MDTSFVRKGEADETVTRETAPRDSQPLTWPVRVLVTLVAVGGVAVVGFAIATAGSTDWWFLAVLTLMAVLAERTDFSMYGSSRVSLGIVPIMAAILSAGYLGAAVVIPAAVLASAWGRPLHKTLFNFGAPMLAGAVSALVVESFREFDYVSDWPQVLAPALLAGLANYGVNSVLVATAISFSGSTRLRDVWNESFLWLLPHYMTLSIIALAIVAAYGAIGFWGVAVFVAPPLMMRLSIKQYVDHTAKSVVDLRRTHDQLQDAHDQVTSAMTSLSRAYDGTLRALVGALDARDSETAGHSERVAELAMAIAAEMGVPRGSDEWRQVGWGALLHDVGKIAIPDQILRKPGRFTEEEWETMRTHPRAGYEILLSVDFLAASAEMVYGHHERYDGHGYPRGLAGEQIPLGSRIFMVADAFDAMTTDRVYRPAMPAEEALAEILRNSGTQFDPTVVRAFLIVYQERFVGTKHHGHLGVRSPVHGKLELSDSLKRAIIEAAGLDDID